MTDEHHFGMYTQQDIDQAVDIALKAERERATRAAFFWAAAAYIVGVIAGLIAR